MKNPKEGAEGANDPAIVVVTPTELSRESAIAQAVGTVVVPDAGLKSAQQEIERLRDEAADLLKKEGALLLEQVQNLMEERDGLVEDKGKLLLKVEELGREASNNVDRANEVARENAALLKLADELKGAYNVSNRKHAEAAAQIRLYVKEGNEALGRERRLTQQLEDEVSRLLLENNQLMEALTAPTNGPSSGGEGTEPGATDVAGDVLTTAHSNSTDTGRDPLDDPTYWI